MVGLILRYGRRDKCDDQGREHEADDQAQFHNISWLGMPAAIPETPDAAITGRLQRHAFRARTSGDALARPGAIALRRNLETGSSLGNTFVSSHRKFTANPWPLLVYRT
jgi:hypothetical protein